MIFGEGFTMRGKRAEVRRYCRGRPVGSIFLHIVGQWRAIKASAVGDSEWVWIDTVCMMFRPDPWPCQKASLAGRIDSPWAVVSDRCGSGGDVDVDGVCEAVWWVDQRHSTVLSRPD